MQLQSKNIQITNNIYMTPFNVNKHWLAYSKLLERNASFLHHVEMNQIVYYETKTLLSMVEAGIKQQSPNFAIYDDNQLIGRIWILKTPYDNIDYDAIGIILDHTYVGKHIMSEVLIKFLELCKTDYKITTILWEAKEVNDISNHLAQKFGFKLYKKLKIDPKAIHPDWTCPYYVLYTKQL